MSNTSQPPSRSKKRRAGSNASPSEAPASPRKLQARRTEIPAEQQREDDWSGNISWEPFIWTIERSHQNVDYHLAKLVNIIRAASNLDPIAEEGAPSAYGTTLERPCEEMIARSQLNIDHHLANLLEILPAVIKSNPNAFEDATPARERGTTPEDPQNDNIAATMAPAQGGDDDDDGGAGEK